MLSRFWGSRSCQEDPCELCSHQGKTGLLSTAPKAEKGRILLLVWWPFWRCWDRFTGTLATVSVWPKRYCKCQFCSIRSSARMEGAATGVGELGREGELSLYLTLWFWTELTSTALLHQISRVNSTRENSYMNFFSSTWGVIVNDFIRKEFILLCPSALGVHVYCPQISL